MKIWKKFIIVSICTILGFILLACLGILVLRYKIVSNRTHLLCEIDHQALLKACRELSKKTANGEIKAAGTYRLHWRFRYSEVESQFPQPILDLKPHLVMIDPNGRVRLVVYRNIFMSGFNAYPENFKPDWPKYYNGNIEIIPGLWYFDEAFVEDAESEKLLREFIEKHKKK